MAILTGSMAQELSAQLLELSDALEDSSGRERIQALMDQACSGEFRLVVVGEIKKGKSSFINALLGHPELLPALSDVATSTVYQVGWGERLSYSVHFNPRELGAPSPSLPPLEIDAAEVAAYGTEDGNPNNQRGVDYIAVELPHPLLKQGLTIIDTPGLGGLFTSHAEILWRYAPAADALFFVLDSVEAVASRPEMEALERLRRMTPLLFFVQTKTDLASQNQWREWQARNLAILAETMAVPAEKLFYFPVSATLKQAADRRSSSDLLRDSGYGALLHFLEVDLMALKDACRAGQLLAAISAEASALNQRGAQQLRALTAKTQEDLNVLDRDAQSARDAFRKWKETTYRNLKSEFDRRSKALKREHADGLKNQLDSGATGPIVGPILQQLLTEDDSADQLVARVDELRSRVIDRCAGEMITIHDAYRQRMQLLIANTTERMGNSLQVLLDAEEPELVIDREPASVAASEHLFDQTRILFRGAATTSALVGYGLLGFGLLFAPVTAAIAIPALIGSMFAGIYFSYDAIKDKRRDKVLINLRGVLTENVRVAQQRAVQQFNVLADQFEYAATDVFNQVVEIRSASLDHQLTQIETARRQTREEKATLGEDLKERLGQLAALINAIDQCRQTTQPAAPDVSAQTIS